MVLKESRYNIHDDHNTTKREREREGVRALILEMFSKLKD